MVYHPNEFETTVTLGQNEPLYCNVPDSLSESLASARLGLTLEENYTCLLANMRNHQPTSGNFLLFHQIDIAL